jgi:hypothetical protein
MGRTNPTTPFPQGIQTPSNTETQGDRPGCDLRSYDFAIRARESQQLCQCFVEAAQLLLVSFLLVKGAGTGCHRHVCNEIENCFGSSDFGRNGDFSPTTDLMT